MLLFSAVTLPLLTMKSFSEERKLRTEQLLLTAPVSLPAMVAGKFLAAYTVFAGAVVVNSLYFLLLYPFAVVKTTLLVGNVLALLLAGLAFISVGLFVSSLTENQLAAAVGTVALLLVFLGIGLLNSLLPANYWLRFVFGSLSLFSRFTMLTNGIFDVASILYYLSFAAIFLYLTVRVFDRRRYE
jgi:ABC-2 type transport system permease protein